MEEGIKNMNEILDGYLAIVLTEESHRLHHITVSTKGVAPVYSNVLLEDGFEEIAGPFVLNGTFEFVDYQKQYYLYSYKNIIR